MKGTSRQSLLCRMYVFSRENSGFVGRFSGDWFAMASFLHYKSRERPVSANIAHNGKKQNTSLAINDRTLSIGYVHLMLLLPLHIITLARFSFSHYCKPIHTNVIRNMRQSNARRPDRPPMRPKETTASSSPEICFIQRFLSTYRHGPFAIDCRLSR